MQLNYRSKEWNKYAFSSIIIFHVRSIDFLSNSLEQPVQGKERFTSVGCFSETEVKANESKIKLDWN